MQKIEQIPSEKFTSMTPLQRQQFVQSIPQRKQQFKNLCQGIDYPQKDFITLQGVEYEKVIKLVTFRYKTKDQSPKGVFVIFHNYWLYSKYTAHLAKKLAQNGYDVVTYDMRGHGLSEGQRGQWTSYKAVIQDGYNFLKKVQQLYPRLPLFIFGSGIVALNVLYISLYFYDKFDFAGVILNCVCYKIPSLGKTFDVLGNIALRIINIVPAKIGVYKPNINYLSKYKNITDMLENDELNSKHQISANSVLQGKELVDSLPQELWDKIDTPPIVIIHGQHDKFGNAYNSYNFFRSIQSKDKQYWYYPEMANCGFLHDQQFYEGSDRLIEWLNRHIKLKKDTIKQQ